MLRICDLVLPTPSLKVMHDFCMELSFRRTSLVQCCAPFSLRYFDFLTARQLLLWIRKVVEELAKDCFTEVEDIEALGMEMSTRQRARLNDTPKALLNRDFKDFEMGEKEDWHRSVWNSLLKIWSLRNLKAKLIEEMDKASKEEGRDDVAFGHPLTFSRKVPD